MKTRNGFVSNSSSSSFIVANLEHSFESMDWKVMVTPSQATLLDEFGFRKALVFTPYKVPETEEKWKSEAKAFEKLQKRKVSGADRAIGKVLNLTEEQLAEDLRRSKMTYSWCYYTACNQDDVIEFLLQNRISFEANVHYEHETYIYDGETDELIIGRNYGNYYSMYKSQIETIDPNKPTDEVPVKKTTGAEYLKH